MSVVVVDEFDQAVCFNLKKSGLLIVCLNAEALRRRGSFRLHAVSPCMSHKARAGLASSRIGIYMQTVQICRRSG